MSPRSLLFLLVAIPAFAGTTPVPKPDGTPATVQNAPVPEATADSVVRVNSTNQSFDFFRPWTKKPPFSRRGLGAVIEGGRVLVTAELVANHNFVELEKPLTAEKSAATVERVDYGSNLAILRPSEPEFLKDFRPLPLDSGARVGDSATVLQLEPNGELAQTSARISSITVSGYPFENIGLLVFRLSAPLQQRDGSFTVPAVRDGRLLGLLMRYDARSQTGDVIPPPVIRQFLDAETPGIPRAGIAFASTRDPQLRRYLGLEEAGGVYVTEILRGGPAEKAGIQKGDVILSVAGQAIDQDGNYSDPEFGRIAFSHLTNTKSRPGGSVPFRIFRDRQIKEVPVVLEVKDRASMLSEPFIVDRAPRFVIVGGLVFLELSRSYLQEWGGNWVKEAPKRLVYYDAFQNEFPPERGKVVILAQVLPTSDTLGYEDLQNLVVSKWNGRVIRQLEDIVEAAKTPVDGFQRIEFEEDPHLIFLDAAAVEKNREALKEQYALPTLERLD